MLNERSDIEMDKSKVKLDSTSTNFSLIEPANESLIKEAYSKYKVESISIKGFSDYIKKKMKSILL